MKTNSNTYTVVYSAVMVVIVAFLLAFVSRSLKPIQDVNVALDVKKQILFSLNIPRDIGDADAEAKYKEIVKEEKEVDGNALYICEVNGERKYVIPLNGMGLWGGISGYISIDDDKTTVYGAYFNHESETAGLGAEIKDSKAWQEKFQGKKIFVEGHGDVALSVVKKVENPETQVDGITGATLTSDGVSEMLHDGIGKYKSFLNDEKF